MLQLTDVTFAYDGGDPPVIDRLAAAMQPGSLCAMIGPNASGKTTLLRLILGQLQPSGGSVHIDDQNTADLTPARRAAVVSYVPQRGLMSFGFTVEEVVAMGRYALRRDDAAVEDALVQADLVKFRGRICRELSAGQQQRVLLARAIAQSAGGGRLMLLDEPSSAMDLLHMHTTMTLLRRLADDGLGVLVVLHDINLAARYADLIWLLDAGRLVASGPWQDVLTPDVLEPVYGVKLAAAQTGDDARPVFIVDSSDTMP